MPRHRSPSRLLAPLVLLALAACGGGEREPEVREPAPRIAPGDPDARRWLLNNPHPYGFARERFAYTRFASELVESLYRAGADTVVIDSTTIRENDYEEYPYASVLKVGLPADAEARESVFLLVNRERRQNGQPPLADYGQPALAMRWNPPPGGDSAAKDPA